MSALVVLFPRPSIFDIIGAITLLILQNLYLEQEQRSKEEEAGLVEVVMMPTRKGTTLKK